MSLSRIFPSDSPLNPDYFEYAVESGDAFLKGTLSKDIQDEQAKVKDADLIILQFPLQVRLPRVEPKLRSSIT